MLLQGLVGVVALPLLAWLLSEDRKGALAGAQRRLVLAGLIVLVGLAVLFAKVPPVKDALTALSGVATALDRATAAGTSFVFGYLGGAPSPLEFKPNQTTAVVLAFRYLPLILVIGDVPVLVEKGGAALLALSR